ncbi:hypothetical protein [Actinomycetospora sp.]|uniref:hypothetical protein n=1 Tax=Actinomycetospora sp. TaxID=1872135 RepID=UPI002F3E79D5
METLERKLYDDLLEQLTELGTISEDAAAGTITLSGLPFQTTAPLRLHLTPASLGSHLETIAPDYADMFPLLKPIEAAWCAFYIHLLADIESAKPGDTDLVLGQVGVVAGRAGE